MCNDWKLSRYIILETIMIIITSSCLDFPTRGLLTLVRVSFAALRGMKNTWIAVKGLQRL